MATWQVQRLAAALTEDSELRASFRLDPEAVVRAGGFALSADELEAMRMVKWAEMSDQEMLVRLRGAAARGTHQTA